MENEKAPYLKILKDFETKDHVYEKLLPYFSLTMSAHWMSAGSFCPTDVDNAIRFHLWNKKETKEVLPQMLQLTYDALSWDYSQVTKKISQHPDPAFRVSTHEGTWFSVAVGAYASALKFENKEWSEKLFEQIHQEIQRELKIAQYWFKEDLYQFILLCPLISHNLGDFDRVIELGTIPKTDKLVEMYFNIGERPGSLFYLCCQYYKKAMSNDGHRHFALRTPKCLRRSNSLLLPVGPFLEGWGEMIAKTDLLTEGEKGEVILELASGWSRLPGDTWGYARAFHGFRDHFKGLKFLINAFSDKDQKHFNHPEFKKRSDMSVEKFREKYITQLQNFKI